MIRYVYPKLPGLRTTPFFRIGGIGLANALFVYARAMLLAEEHGLSVIDPPWPNIRSPKHWFSNETDKRHYFGIFKSVGVHGLKKAWIMSTASRVSEDDYIEHGHSGTVVVVSRIRGKGFVPLRGKDRQVLAILHRSVHARILAKVASYDFSNTIAVHVRRGDYTASRRTPDMWFSTAIVRIKEAFPAARFLLFSDGTRDELEKLLNLPDVEPANFGCSMSDIFGMSMCRAIVASCSTFSDWAAYLGQIPTLFPSPPQFGHVHSAPENEFVVPCEPGKNSADAFDGFLHRISLVN